MQTHRGKTCHSNSIIWFLLQWTDEKWNKRSWVKAIDNNEYATKLKIMTTVTTHRGYNDSNR